MQPISVYYFLGHTTLSNYTCDHGYDILLTQKYKSNFHLNAHFYKNVTEVK